MSIQSNALDYLSSMISNFQEIAATTEFSAPPVITFIRSSGVINRNALDMVRQFMARASGVELLLDNLEDSNNNQNGILEADYNGFLKTEIKDYKPEDPENDINDMTCAICSCALNEMPYLNNNNDKNESEQQQQPKCENVVVLTCKHAYHDVCIETWFKFNSTCPNCRCPYLTKDPSKHEAILNQQYEHHNKHFGHKKLADALHGSDFLE
jgi:hypothetical protein